MSLEKLAGLGLHVLRLQPSEVWNCPFREFLTYALFMTHEHGPPRDVLAALMQRFPDQDSAHKEDTSNAR